ncbi:MAG: DUF389 domain-containing protein [Croceibacterium sp.]
MASEAPAGLMHWPSHYVEAWQRWWHAHVSDTVDQAEVIASRHAECGLSGRYLFMLAMSAGIAILGLLLSSPAVVIGAMLLSPLMGPIIGLGFALAIGDFDWLRQAARTLAVGALLGVALCAVVVLLSPLQNVTSEIAARTRPNLFDLLVALFSAMAGAYAMIRGREGTVVGVAIATALMPPLAVVGFGLATLNWTVFSGALLLLVTNLMTIALTAALMARFYGFSRALSPQQTRFQTILIVLAFMALAIPLGFSLRTIAWEANASRLINAALAKAYPNRVRLAQVDIDYRSQPIAVTATIFTPQLRSTAEGEAEKEILDALGRPADVTLTQFQVGTSATAQEQAELAAAQERESEGVLQAQRLAGRLAIIAGVAQSEVIVDRDNHRAIVAARALPGAGLATYRELERRISAGEEGWTIQIKPPLRPLPSVELKDGKSSDAGDAVLALATWAAQREGVGVLVSGPAKPAADVVSALKENGVDASRSGSGSARQVTLRWDLADSG